MIKHYISFSILQFDELEMLLGETDQARAIFELAVNQRRFNMLQLLWKAYIDFELGLSETDKARALHERLLERTLHVKVGGTCNYYYSETLLDESLGGDALLTLNSGFQ